MVPVKFVAINIALQIPVIVIRELVDREAAQKVSEQKRLMRKFVTLDRDDTFKTSVAVLVDAGREAFAESARTREQIHDWVWLAAMGHIMLLGASHSGSDCKR